VPDESADHWQQELAEAFGDLARRIETLGQDRATIEAVLYAKDRSEEWKRNARLEYELRFEAEFLSKIRKALDARIAERQKLVDEQVRRRREQRER
jgi:hypothetical protein